ncbi:hypothetical protein KCU91_g2908, partial [Aureobasidium melanogenum]
MVVFVDLDDPDEVEHQHQHGHKTPFDMRDLINAHAARSLHHIPEKNTEQIQEEDDRVDHPNLNALSAVLGNYPLCDVYLILRIQHGKQKDSEVDEWKSGHVCQRYGWRVSTMWDCGLPELHHEGPFKHSTQIPPSTTLSHMHQSTIIPTH